MAVFQNESVLAADADLVYRKIAGTCTKVESLASRAVKITKQIYS